MGHGPNQGFSGAPAERAWVWQRRPPQSLCGGAPSKLCRLPDPHFMMLMKSEKEEAKEEMCSCHSFLLFAKVARPIRCGQ